VQHLSTFVIICSVSFLRGFIMHAVARALSPVKPITALAALSLMAGVGGMAISYLYLASAHELDVVAGAAGFVAGSILAAAGLISISLQQPRVSGEALALPAEELPALEPPLDSGRWLAHFRANQENRPEPDWQAPLALSLDLVRPLVRSLEQFQLGDGGGPAYLIAWNRERFLSENPGTRELVDLWFAEEREHARLLGAAVARFGGRCIQGHWSFTAFCLTRKWFGVRFELTVLLLTEIVSTVYYRLLRKHSQDPALRSMCRLILRDEIGHVAFHRDRLARAAKVGWQSYGRCWEAGFRVLGLTAASVLWINHAAGLKALGASTPEFYREIWLGLSHFIRRLRRECAAD
jgi:hypothetical protein